MESYEPLDTDLMTIGTMDAMDGPVVWMCTHNLPSDTCEQCENEDIQVNGEWEKHEEQCQHEWLWGDGQCLDCGEYV